MQPFARSYAMLRDKPGIKYPHAGGQSYAPGQLPAAYGWPTVVPVSPLTIVIGELGGKFYQSDVAPWAAKAGLTAPTVQTYLLPGADDSAGDADGEVALDWQRAAEVWSYMTGRPAQILLVYGPNAAGGMPGVMEYANTLNAIGAGSWSWGSPETQAGSDRAQMDAAAQAAKFPWTAASGDNDSNDGTNAPTVDCPACIPSITGCGGTSRVPSGGAETVWNNGGGEGTGGGFSKLYSRPTWQAASSQGAGRMVPDIAAVADPQTGYDCLINGSWQTIGGTSAVAPLMAGFFAVMNGARVKAGLPMIAQANPVLWGLPSCFFDIISGNNGTYNATVGADPCSGLGRALSALFATMSGSGQTPPPPTPPPSNVTLAQVQAAALSGLAAWAATHTGICHSKILGAAPSVNAALAPLFPNG
jgi:kumamolisin